jgi:predicted transcriptional regulator of viral defense system
MPHRERILELLQTRQIIRPRDLTSRGIPRSYLTHLTEEVVLRRSGRGIYVAAEAEIIERQSLAEVAQRIPHGVICLLSALQFHELTYEVWVTTSRASQPPTPVGPMARTVFHAMQPEPFS